MTQVDVNDRGGMMRSIRSALALVCLLLLAGRTDVIADGEPSECDHLKHIIFPEVVDGRKDAQPARAYLVDETFRIPEEMLNRVRVQLPSGTSELWADLELKNRSSISLGACFRGDSRVTVISHAELDRLLRGEDAWDRFYDRNSGSRGSSVQSFSRIAYDRKSDQMVYCMSRHSGYGHGGECEFSSVRDGKAIRRRLAQWTT